MNKLTISELSILAIFMTFLIIFHFFDLSSPRGFPLHPMQNLYAINDFAAYEKLFSNYSKDIIKVGPLFPSIIFLSKYIIFPSALVIFFIILACIYSFLQSSINTHLIGKDYNTLAACPMFIYFFLFPSTDALQCIMFALTLIYVFSKEFKNLSFLYLLSILAITLSIRPTGFALSGLILFFLFFDFKFRNKIEIVSILFVFLVINTTAIMYYFEYLLIYKSTSAEYITSLGNNLNKSYFLETFFFKFFSTFGIRPSYLTNFGVETTKEYIYVYVRLFIGVFFFLPGFVWLIKLSLSGSRIGRTILLFHFMMYIVCYSGVNFERYYLFFNFLYWEISISKIYPFIYSRIFKKATRIKRTF